MPQIFSYNINIFTYHLSYWTFNNITITCARCVMSDDTIRQELCVLLSFFSPHRFFFVVILILFFYSSLEFHLFSLFISCFHRFDWLFIHFSNSPARMQNASNQVWKRSIPDAIGINIQPAHTWREQATLNMLWIDRWCDEPLANSMWQLTFVKCSNSKKCFLSCNCICSSVAMHG